MTEYNPDHIQGNILRGYRYSKVRHVILQVTDRTAARRFLAASLGSDDPDVPTITRAKAWASPPASAFNIGLTFEGMKALGVPKESLASFPSEFSQGMTKRAAKLGDFGDSAPENWPAPFDQPEKVHLIASVYSDHESELDQVQRKLAKAFGVLGLRDGRALRNPGGQRDPKGKPYDKVFFGYADGITQPQFERGGNPETSDLYLPTDPLGTALLGYSTRMESIRFAVPAPDDLGVNGCFNAFRVLSQDAKGFEDYLSEAATVLMNDRSVNKSGELLVDILLPPGQESRIGAGLDRHGALREIVAAQMMGRWRNGVPLELSPDTPNPDPKVSLTDFNYSHAAHCPAGAHTRRTNPRGGPIVQRIAHYTRRLIRRGMSYGPDFDPANPDDQERGLLGNFICANLGAQFEAVMCDWLNLGLQDPTITNSNDPLIGANVKETSWFDIEIPFGHKIRLYGFPRFVNTRGGAYTFLPSIAAIQWLSKLRG